MIAKWNIIVSSYLKILLPLMLSLAACNTTNAPVSVQTSNEASVTPKKISKAITLHDVGGWHNTMWRAGLYPKTISRVAKVVHANTVTVVDTHFITSLDESGYKIAYRPRKHDWTPTDGQWMKIGNYADNNDIELQMLVTLYNSIGIDQWKTAADADKQNNTKFWDAYFSQYSSLVSKRAKVAEASGVDSIVLGYDGSNDLAQDTKYWKAMIESIKAAGFTGQIGLWTGLDAQHNWSGIKIAEDKSTSSRVRNTLSYFDFVLLQTQDITKNALQRSLRSLKRYNIPLQVMVITPSVSTGVSSKEYIEPATGINNKQNSLAPSRELNFEVQTGAYQAIIDIINDPNFDYVTGINSWGYHFRDDLFYGYEPGDADYQKSANVRKKPAEQLLAKWYKKWD